MNASKKVSKELEDFLEVEKSILDIEAVFKNNVERTFEAYTDSPTKSRLRNRSSSSNKTNSKLFSTTSSEGYLKAPKTVRIAKPPLKKIVPTKSVSPKPISKPVSKPQSASVRP